jgi:putative inorganic carbon (HCO3(-)) transporter
VNGQARWRQTPDFVADNAVITLVAGAAAVLGAVAVHSPKDALLALLAAAFVAAAMTRLPLAVAAFIVLTFPAHLPGSLGTGATLAKPVGALLVLAWGGAVLTRRAALPLLPRVQPVLFSVIVGLLVFGGVSTIWAAAPSQTHSAVGRLLLNAALLGVTWTAASTRSGFRTIVYGYLLGSVVTSVYTISSGSYNTASGRLAGVVDTDYFAAELIPAILIVCFLFITTGSQRTRWLSAAVAGVDLAGFVLTQSRGAIVGLAVALLMGVVLAGRARPRMLALALVLVAGGLGYYYGYKPSHIFQSGKRGGLSAASSGRLDEWRVALRIAEGHPVGGVGLGNYQTVEPSYATQTFNLEFSSFIVTARLVAHNTYLQMAAELGLVGLALFLTILALPLRLAERALSGLERERDELEFYVRGLLAGTVGMLVAYVFLSAEFEKPLWLVLALLASVPALLRGHPTEGRLDRTSTMAR